MLVDQKGKPDGFTQESIARYNAALTSGDKSTIEKAKYELLTDAISLLGVIINYLVLEKNGIHFDFGVNTIKKDTKLYRVRRYHENTNFSDPKEWEAPPQRNRNRANQKGEEALYLASEEFICLLETHMSKDEKYALATYECTDDIKVGGFLSDSLTNEMHNLAGLVLNAFLIAPSRNDRNDELFKYLDSHYGHIEVGDLCDIKLAYEHGGIELPFHFAVMNQRDQLHEMTNALCTILKKNAPCGIRYSSCYLPIETIGIYSNAFNLVLYHDGIPKIRLLKSEIKTCNFSFTYLDPIKCLLESENKTMEHRC